jgi:hypothetical protein
MEQENLEKLVNYVSEHNGVYFSFGKTAKRFNVTKKTFKRYIHNNKSMFEFSKDGSLVGFGGQRKLFFRYMNQKIDLEIN